MAAIDHTDSGFIPLDGRRRRGKPWLKRWQTWAGAFVATAGVLGVLHGWGIVAPPWETRADAQVAHQKLQDSIDALRADQKVRDLAILQGQKAILEEINQLPDELGRRRR